MVLADSQIAPATVSATGAWTWWKVPQSGPSGHPLWPYCRPLPAVTVTLWSGKQSSKMIYQRGSRAPRPKFDIQEILSLLAERMTSSKRSATICAGHTWERGVADWDGWHPFADALRNFDLEGQPASQLDAGTTSSFSCGAPSSPPTSHRSSLLSQPA